MVNHCTGTNFRIDLQWDTRRSLGNFLGQMYASSITSSLAEASGRNTKPRHCYEKRLTSIFDAAAGEMELLGDKLGLGGGLGGFRGNC